jgi:peroxiredoxin
MNPRRILPRAAVAVLATAALALSACTGKNAVDQSGNSGFKFTSATSAGMLVAAGKRAKAANFTGNLLSGGTTNLAQTAGKVVVINFWASWCGPCQVETPQFDELYRRIHTKGVAFLGIDTKDIKSKAQSFVDDKKISYPIVFDEQGETALALGNIPASLPFTVLLDKRGRVAAVYLTRLSSVDLQGPIDKLLAET